MLDKYANLLVNYSLDLKAGERLYIRTTTLAEPLVEKIYAIATKKGVHVDVDFEFKNQKKIFFENASNSQLNDLPLLHKLAMELCDAYLYIRAPYDVFEVHDSDKLKIRSEALRPIQQIYFDRMTNKEMKRSLCQFPTESIAKAANMSLTKYSEFVFTSCKLNESDPERSWQQLSNYQERIVEFLNQKHTIRYKNQRSDISFSTEGRTWINSDGKTNMPSGEVYTTPVEDSVNGHIFFDFPSLYMGNKVEGIQLEVENGEVISWKADVGQEFLDKIMEIPGANRFGEAAIGLNYAIQTSTNNILFDEKIGGTVHMALGQSYGQTGGKNSSSIHWDMIADMNNGGEIYANGELVYTNGDFLRL